MSEKLKIVFPDTYEGFRANLDILEEMKGALYHMGIKIKTVEEDAKNERYRKVVSTVLPVLAENRSVLLTSNGVNDLQAIAELLTFCWALSCKRRMWVVETAAMVKAFMVDSRASWDEDAEKLIKNMHSGLLVWKNVVEQVGGAEKQTGRVLELLRWRSRNRQPVLYTAVVPESKVNSRPLDLVCDKLRLMFGDSMVLLLMETMDHFHLAGKVQKPKTKIL